MKEFRPCQTIKAKIAKGVGSVEPGILVLFVLGIILLFLEIFIPGGILGLLGVGSILLAIVLTADTLVEGLIYTLAALLLVGALVYVSYRSKATRSLWYKMSLSIRQENKAGYVGPQASYEEYVGEQGRAISNLRPAGAVELNGDRVDAVTEGGYIQAGASITVIKVEGTRIIVRESDPG